MTLGSVKCHEVVWKEGEAGTREGSGDSKEVCRAGRQPGAEEGREDGGGDEDGATGSRGLWALECQGTALGAVTDPKHGG